MLGPVMSSGSTGNADTSPADGGMQPDWGLFSRNVHIRDRRTAFSNTKMSLNGGRGDEVNRVGVRGVECRTRGCIEEG